MAGWYLEKENKSLLVNSIYKCSSIFIPIIDFVFEICIIRGKSSFLVINAKFESRQFAIRRLTWNSSFPGNNYLCKNSNGLIQTLWHFKYVVMCLSFTFVLENVKFPSEVVWIRISFRRQKSASSYRWTEKWIWKYTTITMSDKNKILPYASWR